MANEHVPSPATTRSDDQILLFNAWVPIGKGNHVLDLQKKQRNPIFRSMWILCIIQTSSELSLHQLMNSRRYFRNSDVCYHDQEKCEHAGPMVTTLHGGNTTTRMIKRFTVADDLKECSKIIQVKGTKFKDHYIMYKEINA
ncbi:hypothetical protein Tco_1250233 [Tanacetum coccineum]